VDSFEINATKPSKLSSDKLHDFMCAAQYSWNHFGFLVHCFLECTMQIFIFRLLLLSGLGLLSGLSSNIAKAYPSFVAYGYNTCVSCHYNAQGGGAINEYGKGLMASEFASRIFYKKDISEDELSERSGFPGVKSLPWWIRPGLKYRGLWFQTNPGSRSSVSKTITMNADVNLAIQFDQNQKYTLVTSYGYNGSTLVGTAEQMSPWISREHYLRVQSREDLLLYFGLLDKAYGLRIVDHTAFSRKFVGIAQNDQTHGIMAVSSRDPWEYTVHLFLGNLSQEAPLRQKGASFIVENDVRKMLRVGGSGMYSQNDYVGWLRAALHSKYGFSKGNSLLTEFGMIQNSPKGGIATSGLYGLLETMSLIERGIHFLSQFEYYNETASTKSPDRTRWSLGLLMFPAPRWELRANVINGRSISDTSVTSDQWSTQIQLHLSI
jgi:hypothetical protein